MKVIKSIVELQNELFTARKAGQQIGLVPTMGALHAGHVSLVKRCVSENACTVVSVFLNPTQFNNQGDFERYPRTLQADCKLLEEAGVNFVFAPGVADIYPTEDTRTFQFPPFTTVMEGAFRPGHFNGVCQVVSRLFYIVKPLRAYFGEKDWQQVAVIKQLVKHLALPIQIISCPTIRETDGLAMSSRNTLLTPAERSLAPNIYRVLCESKTFAEKHSVAETRTWVIDTINAIEGLEVEYYSIVDGQTFNDIKKWDEHKYVVGCITVNCGNTPIRLIDHITYIPQQG